MLMGGGRSVQVTKAMGWWCGVCGWRRISDEKGPNCWSLVGEGRDGGVPRSKGGEDARTTELTSSAQGIAWPMAKWVQTGGPRLLGGGCFTWFEPPKHSEPADQGVPGVRPPENLIRCMSTRSEGSWTSYIRNLDARGIHRENEGLSFWLWFQVRGARLPAVEGVWRGVSPGPKH